MAADSVSSLPSRRGPDRLPIGRRWWFAPMLALVLHPVLASAQVDLSGNWALQDNQGFRQSVTGPFPDDFLGIPLNAEGRAAAAAASGDEREELHRQCEPWLVQYIVEGPFGVQILPVNDPVTGAVTGWRMTGTPDRMPLTVWTDGRAAPPAAALHTYSGFATGSWRGSTLGVTVTLIKDGMLTRNGAPMSDRAMFRMFISRHDRLLTITGIVHDPVYLDEPYALAQSFKLDPNGSEDEPQIQCSPDEVVPGLSDGYHAASELPWNNPSRTYMMQHYHIPPEASGGGAATMYPEYRRLLRGYTPAGQCKQFCCGATGLGFAPNAGPLHCDTGL